MKTSWRTLSGSRSCSWIISVLIHLILFSIPIVMDREPQSEEIEFFISIDEVQVPPEPVVKPIVFKKLRPEPVKEMVQPIQPFSPKIELPKIIEPVNEVMKESEVIEPVQEVFKEPEFIEPVRKVLKEPVEPEEKPIMTETNRQPATEPHPSLFVPTLPEIPVISSGKPAEGQRIDTKPDTKQQSLVSHYTVRTETETPIETRFGASVAPAFLHRVMPIYPMMARRLGMEGKVVLKLTIDEKGVLREVEVIEKAGYGFTEAAVEAVKKSTFLPAKKDGKPIASRALLPITFQLEKH